MFVAQHAVLPGAERLLGIDVDRSLRRIGTTGTTSGNLYQPDRGPGRIEGGWQGRQREQRRLGAALAVTAAISAGAVYRWTR
ncbi:MAG: hypothetical protein ACRDRK_02040 [Pseudonocardia sp.]